MSNRHGLEWEETLWGIEPRWTEEPRLDVIEQIARQRLHLDVNVPCVVKHYAQGGFNKLFTVDHGTQRSLMRVALPVDPYRKTASEVCTMDFVRKKTDMPIPSIYSYDSSNENDLKFEWILMEFVSGSVLQRTWRKLSLSQKQELVKKLARYQSDLFESRFQKIGNLFEASSEMYKVGPIVSMTFFWGDRGIRDINRGPFKNSHEWLSSRLHLVLESQDKILAISDDEDEIDDAKRAKALAERLIVLLPTTFGPDEVESTMLFHDDLHSQNILVGNDGRIKAVLDWECVSVFPLWMACQPPELLNGATRLEAPQRSEYSSYDPENDSEDEDYNEGKSSLYWTHLLEYERGQLRQSFLSEMENLNPAWLAEYRSGETKRDFQLAILHCDSELAMKRVTAWLDAYDRGEHCSLRESLDS